MPVDRTRRGRPLRWVAALALAGLLASCSPALPSPSTGSAPPSSAAPVPSASATPTPSPSATPLTPEQQYCVDYKEILATQDDPQSDDEQLDIAKLSAWAGDTIAKYEAASRNAPKAIAADYRKVIQYLKDFKVTIDTGDEDAIIAQVRYLPKLNDAMDAIRTASEKLCN